jgi:hypothetical protein
MSTTIASEIILRHRLRGDVTFSLCIVIRIDGRP